MANSLEEALDQFIAEVMASVDVDDGHPDERMVPVPTALHHAAISRVGVVDIRRGRGYVLPDGVYVDPADGSIYCCETLP